MTDKELLAIAREASGRAYVPYSKFDTICAERTACVKAISEGYRDYVRLAIYAESQNYCMPCGSCRQFLSEFNDGELEILCCKADGRYVSYRLKELLPYTFNY